MHHSTGPDQELMEAMKVTMEDKKAALGATGKFPEGKLTEQDEGEIAFSIGTVNGKVVLNFGQATSGIGMSADEAIDVAELLGNRARNIIHEREKKK